MKWVLLCLQNKLIIYLLAVALCCLGLFSLDVIPIAPFPTVTLNNIQIQFSYPGANADTVESQITSKIENALRTIPNVQQVSATSQDGSANLLLTLDSIQSNDLIQTQIKIIQAIGSAHLPSVVQQPQITVAAGQSSLISYILFSDHMTPFDINNFMQATLVPKLSTLPGVSIYAFSRDPIIRISLYPQKLVQYQLSATTIASEMNTIFSSTPLGQLDLGGQAYLLRLKNSIGSLQNFGNTVIGYQNKDVGTPIYLKDVASVTFDSRSLVSNDFNSFNGHTADEMGLYTTSGANPFQAVDAANIYVDTLKKTLPSDLKIVSIFNKAETMHHAFNELTLTVVISALLVLMIALIFLGHLRTTLIPIITIPICLLGSIAFITPLGFSLNMLTLLAMVIAVGLVVDDAIVVVENITRHLEHGMAKKDAIINGTSDIALTIVGITTTLLAVYLPIAFCSGTFIVFLKAFAVPLAAAVFISGIVALTLTPLMCMSLISDRKLNTYQIRFAAFLKSIINHYQRLLNVILKFPFHSLLVIAILICIGAYFDLKLPQSLFPNDPFGMITIQATGTPQDTIDTMRDKIMQFKPFYTNKAVRYYWLNVSNDPITGQLTGMANIEYKPQYLRNTYDFNNKINAYIKAHDLQNTSAMTPNYSNSGGNFDFDFNIYGGSVAQINQAATLLTNIMKKSPLFSTVTNTINQSHKQLEFKINAVKAARFGLYQSDLSNLLSICYGGFQFDNYFNINGLTVPVVMQLDPASLQDPGSLQELQIMNPLTSVYYPVDDFVSLQLTTKPTIISTLNGQPTVQIQANLNKGYSLSDAIPYVNALMADKTPLLNRQYEDDALAYLQGNTQTTLIACLGLLTIYLVLAMLFKNLADPFIILLTVPFSIVGGALMLFPLGSSLNLYSVLALITLIGLITKHGVLIVQFANQELSYGSTVHHAILKATHDRFRPIIMTTLAMALGALPLILSNNLMYMAKRDLGAVLVGGLIIGTCFSLFIVPLVYTLIKRAEDKE